MDTKVISEEARRNSKIVPIRQAALTEIVNSGARMVGGHFKSRDHRHCREYVNRHAFFVRPDRSWRLSQLLLDLIAETIPMRDIQFVAGPVGGGALIANQIAGLLGAVNPIDMSVRYIEIADKPHSEYGYEISPFYADHVNGLSGILVDDVVDSGVTMEACHWQLLQEGGAKIMAHAALVDRGQCNFPWAKELLALYTTPSSEYYSIDSCPMCIASVPITRF